MCLVASNIKEKNKTSKCCNIIIKKSRGVIHYETPCKGFEKVAQCTRERNDALESLVASKKKEKNETSKLCHGNSFQVGVLVVFVQV